jgi:hypothetical protein
VASKVRTGPSSRPVWRSRSARWDPRALIAGHARDGAVIKVGLTDGQLTLSYDNPP